jgi:hypothetical protein
MHQTSSKKQIKKSNGPLRISQDSINLVSQERNQMDSQVDSIYYQKSALVSRRDEEIESLDSANN